MKRKIFLLLFSLIFSFILVSCNKPKDSPPSDSTNPPTENIEEENDTNENESNNNNNNNNNNNVSKKTVRLFYFDTVKYDLYYVDKEIKITDNAIIKSLTNELQNYTPNDNFLNLTDEVEITSSTLDESTGVLKVAFSSSYTNKMLLGSSTEGGLLSSLLSTYGYNLNVDKIAIYFGNELYTSLRGDLPKGYFDVNYDSATQYSKESYNADDTSTSSNVKNMNCRIYYYNANDDMYYYEDKSIEVVDSALVTSLTKELKNIPNDNFLNYGDNLAVKSAKLNNDILTVDLSASYYNMLRSLGSGPEASALKTLALTYSYNYGINKVIILVDGKPYSGSHMMYKDNEYIDINVTNIKEYK